MRKVLIIRFSSFGDIFQCMGAVHSLKDQQTEIHWLTRSDFAPTVACNPEISKVFSVHRKKGFKGLVKLSKQLKKENYTHIYDAHNNQRSHVVCFILSFWLMRWLGLDKTKVIRRCKNRIKRFLWINFKVNLFKMPITAIPTYIHPIKSWVVKNNHDNRLLNFPQINLPFKQYICLAPCATWELKKWPIEYWENLIRLMPNENFILLGGPHDDFTKDIEAIAPKRVKNLSGQCSWTESGYVVQNAKLTIGNDTGMTHLSDYILKPTICIMGAATFCFVSGEKSHSEWSQISCQPCSKDGRGKCKNKIYKKCLFDIRPEAVASQAKQMI